MSTIDNSLYKNLGITTTEDRARADSAKEGLGQGQFLELMMTQLRNQDPFKPMESGEFLSQIAQFSTVSGIQDLQGSFSSLSNSMLSNQALQASTLVGREVLVPAGVAQFNGSTPIKGMVELDSRADNVVVGIYNGAGQLVSQIGLGAQAAGLSNFTWDGKWSDGRAATPGSYSIKVDSTVAGNVVASNTLISGNVDSVVLGRGNEGITVNVTNMGAVDLSAVRRIS
jgi:flagellar basal-body rod modification protein FlgD